jgi:ATP-binding cassette subfamily C protein CydCD
VDLDVPAGSRVGVVGPSGSGKSTLAALLVRFLDPRHGHVGVAGTDLNELALDDVHRLVGLVDDDPHVFSSSVLENVRLARPGASRCQVDAVLRRVSLGPWLDALPDGMDTWVGEGHDAVSGGERARLGLARALLADHPVLVLDEPTAHLDASTADAVARDVLGATEGRAVVWVTHDAVALDAMDHVVDLASYPPVPDRDGAGHSASGLS